MYSAHLSSRTGAPIPAITDHLMKSQKTPGKGACHTKEGIPVIPRAKHEGKSQAGSQPMRRRRGRREYSSLKTAGTRIGIPDHDPVQPSFHLSPPPPPSPPLLTLLPPPLPPPTPPATEPWLTSKLTPGPGGRGRGEVSPG